jgi:hypothetical protein
MQTLKVGRFILGIIVVTILLFIGDGIIHGAILTPQWTAIMTSNGKSWANSNNPGVFAVYALLKAIGILSLYVLLLPRFGRGARNACAAGALVWLLAIPTPLIGLLPMKFFPASFAGEWSLLALVTTLIGAIVGGLIYRD